MLSATPSINQHDVRNPTGHRARSTCLKGVLDAEQGRAFVDRNGAFHFEDRYARERRTTASYAFSTELFAIDSRAAADTIGNRVTVTAGAGTPQVAQDTASIRNFGVVTSAASRRRTCPTTRPQPPSPR